MNGTKDNVNEMTKYIQQANVQQVSKLLGSYSTILRFHHIKKKEKAEEHYLIQHEMPLSSIDALQELNVFLSFTLLLLPSGSSSLSPLVHSPLSPPVSPFLSRFLPLFLTLPSHSPSALVSLSLCSRLTLPLVSPSLPQLSPHSPSGLALSPSALAFSPSAFVSLSLSSRLTLPQLSSHSPSAPVSLSLCSTSFRLSVLFFLFFLSFSSSLLIANGPLSVYPSALVSRLSPSVFFLLGLQPLSYSQPVFPLF